MLRWIDDSHCELEGTTFRLWDIEGAEPPDVVATAAPLVILKPRSMFERYFSLRERLTGGNIVELGVYQGGSTAFLALLLTPRKLVAVEKRANPADALTRFVADHGLKRSVRPYYGVDQSEESRLTEILDEEFGREPIDAVFDDASHQLSETTASFNALFHRVRPGGVFVIEDWSGSHAYERAIRDDEALLAQLPPDPPSVDIPLSRLVLQLVLVNAYAPDVVARVETFPGWVVVERGPADLDAEGFDITSWYGELGDTLLAPLE